MKRFSIVAMMICAALLSLTSCNDMIYDEEGDCGVTYLLKFRYDMNMKFADAFANEVTSVSVYAFDKSGTLVWQKSEKGSALAADDYAMELDLEPGDYDLIAWCGLDNDAKDGESFNVPTMTVGQSKKDDLTCTLQRQHDADGSAYSDKSLYSLFHGSLSVNLPNNEDGEDVTYTMPLTKDTNHLRVILQHLSGEDVDVSKFSFQLDDENGLMNYDNSLLSDENITYRAWQKLSGTAGVDDTDEAKATRATTQVSVAIADMTVARLLTGHKMYLTIRNNDSEIVARVPFIDYALLVKENYGRAMTNQEYLDRQDEYSMTFFLDENDHWISSSIMINSWHVVLNNAEV